MTLVYAHRGASAAYPEHTLTAYEEALRQGVDGVECDIRLTADGVAVLWHDDTVDRCSNGTGRISRMTLAELRRLDVYNWRTDVPPSVNTEIVTLEQLLELTMSHRTPVRLAIETKHPVRTAGAVERELARQLQRFGISTDHDRVMIMSFSRLALLRSSRLLPKLDHVYLVDKRNRFIRNATTGWCSWLGPAANLVLEEPSLVERAHRHGKRVYSWTIDDPAIAARCRDLGVDAIATNRPVPKSPRPPSTGDATAVG